MNEKQLFKALTDVEEKYIEETVEPVRKRSLLSRGWTVAACLTLVIAISISAVALTDAGVFFKGIGSRTWEDGTQEISYDLDVSLDRIPLSEITGSIREVKKIIIQQMQNWNPASSQLSNVWFKYYETSAEALGYLDCARVRFPELGWQETGSRLEVMGNTDGEFRLIMTDVYYEQEGYRIQASANIYTELYENGISVGALDPYRDTYTQDTYVTESGRNAVVIYAEEKDSFCYVDGYLVVEDILYELHIIGGTQESAEKLLYQWLDAF